MSDEKAITPRMAFNTSDTHFVFCAEIGCVSRLEIYADGNLQMSEIVRLRDTLTHMINIDREINKANRDGE